MKHFWTGRLAYVRRVIHRKSRLWIVLSVIWLLLISAGIPYLVVECYKACKRLVNNINQSNINEEGSPLDTLLRGLPWGNIAYGVPSSIPLGSSTNVVLLLSPQKTLAELQALLRTNDDFEDFPNRLDFKRIQIMPRMRATLESDDGKGLEVISKIVTDRAVSFTNDTVWSWRLTGDKPGNYWLDLDLYIVLKVEGSETYEPMYWQSDNVTVTATMWQRISRFWFSNWQWIGTVIGIPTMLFMGKGVWNYIRKRREEKAAATKPIGFYNPTDKINNKR